MSVIKEIRGLKCPNQNSSFIYKEVFPGAKPLSSTRCVRCGYTMSLHKSQK